MAVQWPELDELKQVLDVVSDDWDGLEDEYDLGPTRLERLRLAAIAKVKQDVGLWDEYVDEPDEMLAQAALRMMELLALKPELAAQASGDPTYMRLLAGHRRRFAIA